MAVAPAKAKGPEQFGPYAVHECLGEGGMARVHRAERVAGDGPRTIALKRMWSHLSEDEEFVQSFVQEAQLASRLRHENIAQAYELGRIEGTFYIAMELVPGATLNQIMIQSRTAAGAIPLPIIVEILIQLCDALDHAHNLKDDNGRPLGIIHRDVSPANVIISNAGTVKLIDFGISKANRSRVHTQAGVIKGKLSYVAPEYTRGKLDARADLFAIGVVAHELITGRRLFIAETDIETIENIREKPIQPPSRQNSAVPVDLDHVVITALQRDPELRWQNAAAMRTALVGVAEQLGRVSGAQIRAWVEWAFMQEPWRDSVVGKLLETWEPTRMAEARDSAKALAPAPPQADPTPTVPSPRPIMMMHAPRTSPWLVLLLIATMLGAAAWFGWLDVVLQRAA